MFHASNQQPQIPQLQRKDLQQFIPSDVQAREKLSHFVYEYLVHMGASKTAEMFKNEVLAHSNNGNIQIESSAPGFLANWFCVFWDLYSVHPDKRERAEPSNDARTYHKMMFHASGCSEVPNGGLFGPGPPGFLNHNIGQIGGGGGPPQNLADNNFPPVGCFNGPPRAGPQPAAVSQASPIPGGSVPRYNPQQNVRSGAPTPSNGMPGPNSFPPPPHQLNSVQMNEMRMMLAQQQQQQQRQMSQQQMRLPLNMAPTSSSAKQILRPQFQQFMDSPSGTPPFPSALSLNGAGGPGMGTSSGALLMSPGTSVPASSSHSLQQQQQMPPVVMMSVPGVGGGGPTSGMQMKAPIGSVECSGGGGPGSVEPTPRFMMMGGGVASTSMQAQFVAQSESGGCSSSGSIGLGSSVSASTSQQIGSGLNMNEVSIGELAGMGGGKGGGNPASAHLVAVQQHQQTSRNDIEMKQSPASVHQFGSVGSVAGNLPGNIAVNGGTPATSLGGGQLGGSVGGPGSVHSQQDIGTAVQQIQQSNSEPIELGGHMAIHQSDEISKIKASLMDGYSQGHHFQQQQQQQ